MLKTRSVALPALVIIIMKAKQQSKPDSPNVSLHILDVPTDVATPRKTTDPLGNLQALLKTISLVTGLDVCIYPPPRQASSSKIRNLPVGYLRHMSTFCRAAKRTRDGHGCRGHDSTLTNARAASMGRPFVQTCHRGVAEVIVPIFNGDEHLGTVFIGQVITPEIEARGFDAIWESAKDQVTHRAQLARGFEQLPRMTEEKLQSIGILADAAIRGLADQLSNDAFAEQVRLESAPAIRRAVDILHQQRCWDITASQMAQQVHLSPAHFSRLFHRIMGMTYSHYLTQLRFYAAQNLLHHSDMPIAQIAQHCGFSRQSYFTRRFREFYGMTPSAFRSHVSRPQSVA
jgi:AraC-like DNA-binding protein